MKFEELGLRDELLRVIEESGYPHPTPIQERAIPKTLEGRDLICCAQTGTGKTAAFALPILHRLAEGPRANLRALILVPTRELAIQVGRSLTAYGKYLELEATTVYGGVPIGPQEMMLRHGVDILVATPGRLKDHVWRGNIDFRHTQILVLDEADRMLDMGFIKAVREIVDYLPSERQSILLSATLDEGIRRFSQGILRNPERIEVAPPATTLAEIDQFLLRTTRGQKQSALERLIRQQEMKRTIVFARTKSGASRLAGRLAERGHKASAIHSDRTQDQRVRALEGFREGRIHLLVATDIAARGLDVDDVSHVVNFDLPYSPKDYVHRIGRTARAGRRGVAISLVTPEDSGTIAAIERLISQRLSWLEEPGSRSSRGAQPASSRERSPRRGTRRSPRDDGQREDHPAQRESAGRGDPGQQGAQRRTRPPRRRQRSAAGVRRAEQPRPARQGVAVDARPKRVPRSEKPVPRSEPRPIGFVQSILRRLRKH
ncbi:MAG: DEAD/DEAH box helicase [Candidatus Eisenbacteria sp.]|nr:DEAD/DEAH box helicase [Candidatus Eisenbacteria bacterium]